MQHYELPEGTVPEGTNRLIFAFTDSSAFTNISLESTFEEKFRIYGELSLFCSYTYYWRAYFAKSEELDSEPYWNLERILTGPPLVKPDGSWALRGMPLSSLSGRVSEHSIPDTGVKHKFTASQQLKRAEITAGTFPDESQLHRTLAKHGEQHLTGELAEIEVEAEGMGWRRRHQAGYAALSVAHLFAYLLSRHQGDTTFDAVLARAAINCLFPSVLNPDSAQADQRYFAALAARQAFTGKSMDQV